MAIRRSDSWSKARFAQSIGAAREGSYSALGQLFDHYRDYLLRVANHEIRPDLLGKVAPSDFVQETFLDATKAFPQFDGKTESELRAWLRKILINNLCDTQKYFRTHKRSVTREVPLEADGAARLPSVEPRPSSLLASREQRTAVEQAIARLPEDYRRVLRLRSLEERPFEEVGRELERSADAARRLWSRAIQMLAMELDG